MICPNCNSENTKVYESRQLPLYRRRRYKCLMCGERFTTKEYLSKMGFSNADRFRQRTDEQLAAFLARHTTPMDYPQEVWDAVLGGDSCNDAWLKWLQAAAGEGST